MVPIKSTTTKRGERGGGSPKESSEQVKTHLYSINVSLESLLSESFLSLGVTVHFTSLGCPSTLC